MELHEYQIRQQLIQFDIPIPHGHTTDSPKKIGALAQEFGPRVVIKNHNRVYYPETLDEIETYDLSGTVLVEEFIDVRQHIYLTITNDYNLGKSVLLTAATDETDEVIKPESFLKEVIDPFLGLRMHQITSAVSTINLPHEHWQTFSQIAQQLYQCYIQSDATFIELNPLVITNDDRLIALNYTMHIDENALFRQPAFARKAGTVMARNAAIDYIPLEGDIACIGNGAGSVMTMMDMIAHHSEGELRCGAFVDLGSNLDADKFTEAFLIVLAKPELNSILMNIFSGFIPCDVIAKNILEAYRRTLPDIPLTLRLYGTDVQEGYQVLADSHIPNIVTMSTLNDAVLSVVNRAKLWQF